MGPSPYTYVRGFHTSGILVERLESKNYGPGQEAIDKTLAGALHDLLNEMKKQNLTNEHIVTLSHSVTVVPETIPRGDKPCYRIICGALALCKKEA